MSGEESFNGMYVKQLPFNTQMLDLKGLALWNENTEVDKGACLFYVK